MNYEGKSPLKMRCPHCGKLGPHSVISTEPKIYHWNAETVKLFERIAGRDISFRRRVKKCVHCGAQFITVEMANAFLDALINEVQKLASELRNLESLWRSSEQLITKLENERKTTFSVIRKASKSLNAQLPKRPKKLKAK